MHRRLLVHVGAGSLLVASLLAGCGVTDRPMTAMQTSPTAGALVPVAPYPLSAATVVPAQAEAGAYPLSQGSDFTDDLIGPTYEQQFIETPVDGTQTPTPVVATPSSFAEQTNIALDATRAASHLREYQTVAAQGPPPTIGPPPTPDLRPTSVSPWLIKIPGGGYLAQDIGYPSKMPRYVDAWTLDFPEERTSVTVWAGGYLYTPETYDQELLKPEQGAIAVDVFGFRPGMPDRRLDDPRTERLTLPVRDGMARIVDALVTDDRITVMLRTDASAYTYEVNTHTLAVAQPPTIEPGGPYRVRAGELLNLEAQGRDIAGTQFDYAWDLDGDGVFEVRSQRATLSARDLSGSQTRTITVRVTARNGLSSTAQVPVAVLAP